MPAIGKTEQVPTNLIQEIPVLPYPLLSGQITWTDSFDENLDGSITYEHVGEAEANAIQAAYMASPKVNLYGLPFKVTRFGYDRVAADTDTVKLDIYKFTVALEGDVPKIDEDAQAYAESFGYISYADGGVFRSLVESTSATQRNNFNAAIESLNQQIKLGEARLQALSMTDPGRTQTRNDLSELQIQHTTLQRALTAVPAPSGAFFARHQVTTDGSNEVSLEPEGFNDAELTWGDDSTSGINDPNKSPRVFFKQQEPEVVELVEASQAYDQPPENTVVLRDTTVENFDESGEKKIWKKVTRVQGEPLSEECRTYGFAYLYEDIHAGDGVLYSGNPSAFWQEVEYRLTTYIYKKGPPVGFRINITDNGERVKWMVHPDYAPYSNISADGGSVLIRSNAEYLTEVITEGWKLVRLKKEDANRNTLDPGDPYYPAFQFRKTPFYSRTVYVLDSSRRQFQQSGESVNPPFSIEFSDFNSLELRIQQLFNRGETTIDGRVAILYPDPNYVEPLYVRMELSGSSSFEWMPDPEAEADPDRFVEGTNIPAPAPRLMTGEESRNEIERTLLSAERYSERVSEYSSQDPGFDNAIEHISFREMEGTSPSPAHRILQYEKDEYQAEQVRLGGGSAEVKYYVSTANKNQLDSGGSVSVPKAKSQQEAVMGAEVQLRKESMSNSQAQKTVFGFHPNLRAGQVIITEKDRFSSLGMWRAMSVSWTQDYGGIVDGLGLKVTTPGTSLTLGLDRYAPVSVESRTDPSSNGGDRSSDPKLDIQVTGAGAVAEVVLPVLPGRRNF